MNTPDFDADFVCLFLLILGSIPNDARQKIQDGETDNLLEQTIGNAILRFSQLEGLNRV